MKLTIAILILVASLCQTVWAKGVINCYYGTWSYYRPGLGKFEPSLIDPKLCTHLSYSFFGINDSGEFKILDSWLDIDLGNIAKTIALKQANPQLKIVAVIGGWNEGSTKYSSMAADATKRALFISSTLAFMRQYGFDGLDLDWEYPGQRGGSSLDRNNFVLLLKELKKALSVYNLELSIAVGASESTASLSYKIPEIANHVDYINVMTYDFTASGAGVLGFNAPLYGGVDSNNVYASLSYWIQQGAPAEKLVLGLPFYGHTFQMANTQATQPGSLSVGAGSAGPYTQEAGFLGYNEICADLNSWTVVWQAIEKVPYAYKGNQWLSYDNEQSLQMKMSLINSLNLGGVMVWSMETDDFRGNCGQAYPLLRLINSQMKNITPGTSTNAPSTNTTTTSSTTSAPNHGVCSVDGFYNTPGSCSKYYRCVNGIRYEFECQTGLYFDKVQQICNWANAVQCVL